MAKHTYYRLGGPARYFFKPLRQEDLQKIIERCLNNNVEFIFLGKGANVLFSDKGFDGLVLNLEDCCSGFERKGEKSTDIHCGAGAVLFKIVLEAEKLGLAGLEMLSGIPGTVGGALRMNAGAFGAEIGDVVNSVDVLDPITLKAMRLFKNSIDFGYRSAPLLENKLIVSATIRLQPSEPALLGRKRREILEARKAKQPLDLPSCGSVFKRPVGDYAGRLIEAAGCKGLKSGHAWVSEKHANFIVHDGKGTSKDVFDLIAQVKHRVETAFGVVLEPEVQLIGF